MDKKCFEIIAGRVDETLQQDEFSRQPVDVEDGKEQVALYTGDATAYSVNYNPDSKKCELRTCTMTEEGPDNNWKTISLWLFDPETDGEKEAESISNDFVDTIEGPKRKAIVQATKKKKKDQEGNVDPLFFMNRMVNIFPELKEEIRIEREQYGSIRGVAFTENNLLPKINELFTLYPNDTARIEKMATVFSDMYHSGDLDVRSLVTYIILNSLEEKDIQRMEEKFSDDLKKAWKASRRFKGKNIKPEKQKKKKKFMASTLDARK